LTAAAIPVNSATGPAICSSKGPTCEPSSTPLLASSADHDLSRVGVNADMELSPEPTRPCGVILDEPLTGTGELEPCAVRQQVYQLPDPWSRHRQCLIPSAQGQMVGRHEIKTKQPKEGCDQPFRLA
jgi:hypothetical protein